MASVEALPYDDIAEAVSPRLAGKPSYEPVDCTGEFQDWSIEAFGGNVFGENAIVSCAATPQGPDIHFYDRVLRGVRGSHIFGLPLSLHVATLTRKERSINAGAEPVFLDWLAVRNITDEGKFVFNGMREAVTRSPLHHAAERVPTSIVQSSVSWAGAARLAQAASATQVPTQEQIAHRRRVLLEVATTLSGNPHAVDIAEVIVTEDRVVPHVLRNPDAPPALERLAHTTSIACSERGMWVATEGFGSTILIKKEAFFPIATDRHDVIESTIEPAFRDIVGGIRVFKAVGDAFTRQERNAIDAYGWALRRSTLDKWGAEHTVQHRIERDPWPHGMLLRGHVGVDYSIYIPQ